jgi:hypothetical protein
MGPRLVSRQGFRYHTQSKDYDQREKDQFHFAFPPERRPRWFSKCLSASGSTLGGGPFS